MKLLVLGTMVAILLAPLGSEAQQVTNCEATFEGDLSPGLTVADGRSGTFTSHGETGTMVCDGPVYGASPTGSGTYGASGHYGTKDPDTCALGEGDYAISATIPTAGGAVDLSDQGTFTRRGLRGDFGGKRYSGTFDFAPKEGDCVTKPVTKATVVARWTLRGY
jgi:hypothetical protein